MSDEKAAAVRRAAESHYKHLNKAWGLPFVYDYPQRDAMTAAFDASGVWERIEELAREITAHEAILMDQSRGAAARAHENERLRELAEAVAGCKVKTSCPHCKDHAVRTLAETQGPPRADSATEGEPE